MKPDDIDKKLIKLLQTAFPLVSRPFRHMATTLVIEEDEVIQRVKQLKDSGLIRRIGPLLDYKTFGYKGTLIAIKTNPDTENGLIDYLNSNKNITHNYKRDAEYDLWFTYIYKNDAELNNYIKEIMEKFNIEDILILPAVKTYKLRTEFHAD